MGFYTMLFGVNRDAPKLLEALGLTEKDFYRFRDAYLTKRDEIAVYTRGGGGNRKCYCKGVEDGSHREDCVVPIQASLRTHPLYLADKDDEFDRTYCTFYFRIHEEAREILENVEPEDDREEIWQQLFSAMKKVPR